MHCPSPATVGASNSAATGKSMPNAARVRAIAWVATSECPPASKKSSWMLTRSRPSTSAQIAASLCSIGVRGATKDVPAALASSCGAGNAARSSLPLAVRGSASRSTKAAGTMNEGSRAASAARRPAASRRRAPGRQTT